MLPRVADSGVAVQGSAACGRQSRGLLVWLIACALAVTRAEEEPACPVWASQGECASNPAYMLAHCAEACSKLDLPHALDDAPTDLEPECAGYARVGECARNPAFMLSRCRPSCNAWEREHGITLDTDGRCVDDALVGKCVEDAEAMAIRCNASCEIARKCRAQRIVSLGVCDKAMRCEAVDLDDDCAARAARGECASQGLTMAQRCLQTCSRVDMDSVMRAHLPEAPVILSPLIDVPRAASAAASRCGLAPYPARINTYKLHYPDRCYVHSAAPRRARSARDTARARVAALRLYRAAPRTAAQRAGYVHATNDAPDPCPYDAATTTARVSGAPRVVRPPAGGAWHTAHSVTVVQVLASPRVRLLHDFLVDSEAAELIALAQPLFRPSPVRSVATSKRTSTTAMLPSDADIVRRVRARVAHFSGYPLDSLEPMQIVRYEPSQRYEAHHDLFDLCDFEQRPRRHITFLIYLSDLPAGAGGETTFPRLRLSVQPRKNSALVFNDALDDGWDDERTEHAGTPPSSGVKYAVNLWLREPREGGEGRGGNKEEDGGEEDAPAELAAATSTARSLSESRWRESDLRVMAYSSMGATVILVVATWARRKPASR